MLPSAQLTRLSVYSLMLFSLALGGCGLFYKQPLQQGNVLEQDQVDLLTPGMTKRQVALIIGTPVMVSPFHHDRWDYVSTFRDRNKNEERKNFTVYFEDGVLARLEGDYQPGGGSEDDNAKKSEDAIKEVDPDA